MNKNISTRTVGPETARMLALGHPWVTEDAFTRNWQDGRPGDTISLENAEGTFLATALLDPGERIIARVLDNKPVEINTPWLTKRLEQAIMLRRHHAALSDSTAYRLINAEGDGLPGLVIDRYGDYLMIQLYSNAWKPHLPLLTRALQDVLAPRGIYEKNRPQKTRELEAVSESKIYGRLLTGKAAGTNHEVTENGLSFIVQLERGLNSGLFLDQRRNRRDLMTRASGKRVLNLFAYTGAFSVAAAASGAVQVTGVDVSQGYTDWAKNNFSANNISPEKHRFIVGDCLTALKQLARDRETFDIIIMDPPSFSTAARHRFTTRGGTSDLVAAALPLLVANGLLITSSNLQKIDTADYLKELRRGALQVNADLRVIQQFGQPEDFPHPVTFPEGRYLKYLISVKG